MADRVEITGYKYYVFSSRDDGAKAVIILSGDNGVIGYVHFSGGDRALLEARRFDNGRYLLHYRYSELDDIVDMLRNEKPIYLIYQPEGTNNSRISTTSEPVGEGEED